MPKRTSLIRKIIAVLVLAATATVFTTYYYHHHEVQEQLQNTQLSLLALLLGLYVLFVSSLALINVATLQLSNAKLGARETILLTIYSSIINFFGPLQSGPAFRAVYLKKKHGVNLQDYTAATLLYYVFYATVSGVLIMYGVIGIKIAPVFVMAALLLFLASRKWPAALDRFKGLTPSSIALLGFATSIQIGLLVIIYYVELQSILTSVSLSQVVVYTGAANFALFVSVTPGAIGFRESFLLFTEKLHHIANDTIVVANTIDRSIYILLLVLLAAGLFGTHAQRAFTQYAKPKD
ncbi:MAG: lysylphosphatidylglycerol synthase domain-containing protein [Patescibacteria group bacterium]|nr:lysylphosphatidylglycerol synthase domain-containing protein [Patescibacteria group bacterium]